MYLLDIKQEEAYGTSPNFESEEEPVFDSLGKFKEETWLILC